MGHNEGIAQVFVLSSLPLVFIFSVTHNAQVK